MTPPKEVEVEIRFACPSCGAKLALSQEFAGGEVRCPKCGTTSVAPAPQEPAPVAAIPVAAPMARKDQHRCPACSEMYDARASKCPHCGEWFDDAVRAKHGIASADGPTGDDSLSAGEWVVAIVCSTIGLIVGIVWLITGNPKWKKMLVTSVIMQVFWFVVKMGASGGRF